MNKQASLTKFAINEKLFYVKIFWKPNDNDLFNIIIYDGDLAWSGRFSYDFARKYQEICNESQEQYMNNVKRALVKDSNFSYDFSVLPDDGTFATFSWKKKMKGFDTLLHGSVPLHCEEAETKQSKDLILDFLLAENHELRNTLESVNAKNAELSTNLDTCRNDFDRFIEIKTSLEMSLYSKFVQLLNAKKRRLELLDINVNDSDKTNVKNIEDELD